MLYAAQTGAQTTTHPRSGSHDTVHRRPRPRVEKGFTRHSGAPPAPLDDSSKPSIISNLTLVNRSCRNGENLGGRGSRLHRCTNAERDIDTT